MQEHIHDAEQHIHDAEEHIHDVSNIIGYISRINLVFNDKLSIRRISSVVYDVRFSPVCFGFEPCLFRVRARLRAFLLCFFFFLTHEYFFFLYSYNFSQF